MALFGGKRDAIFVASVNSEVINAIVDTEIEFFKLHVETSAANIYGESDKKSYYSSILIPCLITKDDKTPNMDQYGHTYTRTSQFALSRDILERAAFFPEVGDVVFWDNEYYELDNVDANQYFVGKVPDYAYSEGLDQYGSSISIACTAHLVPADKLGITKERM